MLFLDSSTRSNTTNLLKKNSILSKNKETDSGEHVKKKHEGRVEFATSTNTLTVDSNFNRLNSDLKQQKSSTLRVNSFSNSIGSSNQNENGKKLKTSTDMTKSSQSFYNQQEKAFRQLAAIVIGFTICFLPYFVLFLIIALCNDCVNPNLFTVTIWLGYVNSTLNPFLYALSNRKFRQRISIKRMTKQKNTTSVLSFAKTDTTQSTFNKINNNCA